MLAPTLGLQNRFLSDSPFALKKKRTKIGHIVSSSVTTINDRVMEKLESSRETFRTNLTMSYFATHRRSLRNWPWSTIGNIHGLVRFAWIDVDLGP